MNAHDPVLAVERLPPGDHLVVKVVQYSLPIVGMNQLSPGPQQSRGARFDAEDLVERLRLGPGAGLEIQYIASNARDPLRFLQPMLTRLKRLFGALALRDGGADGERQHGEDADEGLQD